jgi:hypothetical protein
LEGTQHSRVGFIYKSEASTIIPEAIHAVQSFSTAAKSLDFTLKLLQQSGDITLDNIISVAEMAKVNTEKLKDILSNQAKHTDLSSHVQFCHSKLSLDNAEVAIITNGRARGLYFRKADLLR